MSARKRSSGRRWTELEKEKLRWAWKEVAWRGMLLLFPDRSLMAIYEEAKRLKLGMGRKSGAVGIRFLAATLGYCPRYLWKILEFSNVAVHSLNCLRTSPKHYRWSIEVEAAVKAVMRWERVALNSMQAAEVLHVRVGTLRQWMVEDGHELLGKDGRRLWNWKALPSEWRAAYKKRRGGGDGEEAIEEGDGDSSAGSDWGLEEDDG